MKTKLYKAEDRGFANHGWLQANYSFSFSNYYNPEKMNFGALRVLNDDLIAPGMGFGTHPHDNMEIITIPLSGELKHRDSMSNQWQSLKAGEVQVMTAGTGIMHSEINGSSKESLSLFQIWIMPKYRNVEPNYNQTYFNKNKRINKLQTLVSSVENNEDGLKINQDAKISRISLEEGKSLKYDLDQGKGVYIMTVFGKHQVNNNTLQTRDAIGITETDSFTIDAHEETDLVLIEVPMN